VRHSGDQQARSEEQSRHECGEKFHDVLPWRTTNTVTIAAVMNTSAATSERVDRFARPHTPWPLVQPPPICVPAPTSSPDTVAQSHEYGNNAGPVPRISAGISRPSRKARR